MYLKNILLFVTILLNFVVIGQTDSAQIEKHIYLKKPSNDKITASIKKWDEVKIWLRGADEPVKGFVTYLNDSTVLMNETMVAIEQIEKIRITPAGGKFFGTVIVLGAGVLTGAGILMMLDANGAPGLASFFYFLVGAAATGIGVPTAIAGTAVLITNSKKYDLTEWEFQFKEKKSK